MWSITNWLNCGQSKEKKKKKLNNCNCLLNSWNNSFKMNYSIFFSCLCEVFIRLNFLDFIRFVFSCRYALFHSVMRIIVCMSNGGNHLSSLIQYAYWKLYKTKFMTNGSESLCLSHHIMNYKIIFCNNFELERDVYHVQPRAYLAGFFFLFECIDFRELPCTVTCLINTRDI